MEKDIYSKVPIYQNLTEYSYNISKSSHSGSSNSKSDRLSDNNLFDRVWKYSNNKKYNENEKNPLEDESEEFDQDEIISDDEFGPDLNREASFAFIRQDLVDINLVPEVGDIVMWHEDYYEVDTVKENQLFLGRDKSYNFTEYGDQFGSSVSIIVECHLTRADKVGITKVR